VLRAAFTRGGYKDRGQGTGYGLNIHPKKTNDYKKTHLFPRTSKNPQATRRTQNPERKTLNTERKTQNAKR